MKDKDLKNFKPNGGIRPSPLLFYRSSAWWPVRSTWW